MSISSGRASGWEDLEIQRIGYPYQVSDAAIQADDTSWGPRSDEFEPLAGSLQRSEMAELVAIVPLQHKMRFEQDTVQTQEDGPAWARGEVELSLNDTETVSTEGVSGAQNELRLSGNSFPNDTINKSLYFSHVIAGQGYEDETNGTGGGSAPEEQYAGSGHAVMHFRDLFGKGPVVDHRDTLNLAAFVSGYNVDEDVNIQANWTADLFWEVNEEA